MRQPVTHQGHIQREMESGLVARHWAFPSPQLGWESFETLGTCYLLLCNKLSQSTVIRSTAAHVYYYFCNFSSASWSLASTFTMMGRVVPCGQ